MKRLRGLPVWRRYLYLGAVMLASSHLAVAVEVVAGTGSPGASDVNGPALSTQLNRPQAVFTNVDGTLLVADSGNGRIVEIDSQGMLHEISGLSTGSRLKFPTAIQSDGATGWWIADPEAQSVFHYRPIFGFETTLGNGVEEAANSDVGTPLLFPSSVLPDGEGTLISEMGTGRILRGDATTSVTVVAAGLTAPSGLARDVDDIPLVAGYGSGEILRLVSGGPVTVVSLISPVAPDDDPPVDLPLPTSVAVGADGSLYIAAPDVSTVYRFDPSGALTLFLKAPDVLRPIGLSVGKDGRLFIADEGRHQVLAQTLAFPAPLPGDVDGDGSVTVKDALLSLRLLVDSAPFNRRQFLASDVFPAAGNNLPRGDHRLSVQDVTRLLRAVVGLETSL